MMSLAWPVVASMILHSLYTIADLFWVGRVSTAAVAAVSTGFFLSWTLISLGEMISVGVLSLVARNLGSKRPSEAARISWQGFFWIGVIGVVLAVAGQWLTEPIYRMISEDPEVRRLGTQYLSVLFFIAPLWYVNIMFEDILRGCGDTHTPFRVLLATVTVNFLLDPVLILGLGPVPAMGVRGAAVATGVAQLTGVLLYIRVARSGVLPFSLRLDFRRFRPSLADARSMIGIGLPITSIGIMFSVVYLFLSRIAGGFGTTTLAALGLVNRIESLSFMTGLGLGVATSSYVGQNLGAGQPDRAARGAAVPGWMGMGVGATAAIAFWFVPEQLMSLFTDDPATIDEGVRFLRILVWCQVFQVWELVLEGGFSGAGHTLPAMLISVPMSIVRIPAAWFLAVHQGWGPSGIWWTISFTAALRGVLLRWWWGRGTWKTVGHITQQSGPEEAEA